MRLNYPVLVTFKRRRYDGCGEPCLRIIFYLRNISAITSCTHIHFA